MSTLVSLSSTPAAFQAAPAAAAVAPARRGFWSRLLARIIEARRQQAERELQRHGLQLPWELEAAGLKINERNEDSLPFIR